MRDKDSLLSCLLGATVVVMALYGYINYTLMHPIIGHVQLELVGVTQYENGGETFYVPLYRRRKK